MVVIRITCAAESWQCRWSKSEPEGLELAHTPCVTISTVLQAFLNISINASVALASRISSSVLLVSLSPAGNATSVVTARNASQLLQVNPSTVRVGERVYVIVDLKTASKQPVLLLYKTLLTLTGKQDS